MTMTIFLLAKLTPVTKMKSVGTLSPSTHPIELMTKVLPTYFWFSQAAGCGWCSHEIQESLLLHQHLNQNE